MEKIITKQKGNFMNKNHIDDEALQIAAKELRKQGFGEFSAQRVAFVAIATYLAYTAFQCDLNAIAEYRFEEPHAN